MSGCPSRELFDRLLDDQLGEAERQSLENVARPLSFVEEDEAA